MPEVYFHLDDSDLKRVLAPNYIEEKKGKKVKEKKPKICPICETENAQENLICWNCGNIIKEGDRKEIGIELITQPYQIEELREENKKINDNLKNLTSTVKELKEMIINRDLSFITPLPDVFAEDEEKEAEISREKSQKAKRLEEDFKKP